MIAGLALLACGDGPDDVADVTPAPDTVEPSADPIHFSDGSAQLGAPESELAGVSLADFDGDGNPDATLAGEEGVQIYRNIGGGQFERVTGTPSGPAGAAAAIWADVDGDADLDLFITTRDGPDSLWRNDDGALVDATADSGIIGETFGEGASFGDLDGDGDLDLIVCQGVTRDEGGPNEGELGTRGNPNKAYRNNGSGKFEDVTEAWGLAGLATGETFGAMLFDVDGDFDLDVLMVHDAQPDQLFTNPGDGGAFVDDSKKYLPADDSSIMGMDIADFDGDGNLDVYGTTAVSDRLYLRGQDGEFANQYSDLIGDGVDQSVLLIGWGVGFIDVDNDGDLDVMTTASYSDGGEAEGTTPSPGAMTLLRYDTPLHDSRHEESGPGDMVDISWTSGDVLLPSVNGWGLALGDVDRDGDQDVLVGLNKNIDESLVAPDDTPHKRALLLINDSRDAGTNHSLRLDLRQPGTKNVFAIGAEVTVKSDENLITRVMTCGTSYLSQHENALHFGLGAGKRALTTRVRWPDGKVQIWLGQEAGAHELVRDDAKPCCGNDGQCWDLDEQSCNAKLSEVLGLADKCKQVCEKLETCDALKEADFENRASCVDECSSWPPPEASLNCVIDAECAALEPCLADL